MEPTLPDPNTYLLQFYREPMAITLYPMQVQYRVWERVQRTDGAWEWREVTSEQP